MKLKIVFTTPPENADELRMAIGKAGGGNLGNYSYCSFSVLGTGRFMPNEKANPHIGESGKLEQVIEERIEIVCLSSDARKIIDAIKTTHPYEEIALDIYQLIDESEFI